MDSVPESEVVRVLSSKDIYGSAIFMHFVDNLEPELKAMVFSGDSPEQANKVYDAAQAYVLTFKALQTALAKSFEQLALDVHGVDLTD